MTANMKTRGKFIIAMLLLFLAMILTGCRQSQYIENKAYAVMMGIDKENDGFWKITVRIPGMGGGSQNDGASQEKSEYLTFKATGSDFQSALRTLRAGIPRALNLAALTVIVISEDIAASGDMPLLLDTLSAERKIYGTTRMAVCTGKAEEFVEKQEPVIGSILSEGLMSRLQNLAEAGYIPSSQLDTIYFYTKSIYSDPMIMLCALADDTSGKTENITAGSMPVEAEGKNRYMGAGIMKDGILTEKLDGQKTMYVNLLRGYVDGFSISLGGDTIQLALRKKPDIKIDIDDEKAVIEVKLKLSALGIPDIPEKTNIENAVKADLEETIRHLQSLKIEPFGFADIAASDFFTIGSWRSINWREIFSKADVNICIDVKNVDQT